MPSDSMWTNLRANITLRRSYTGVLPLNGDKYKACGKGREKGMMKRGAILTANVD